MFIVISSYVFYGWWDWRFLSLIVFSTLLDYSLGLFIFKQDDKKKRKVLLSLSIVANLGLLGGFKYYNFFLDNFVTAFSFFGKELSPHSLTIILPVGISFYTFQTLSATIDIYRGKMKPTNNLIQYAAFVSFFPQLVAGPIERATNLLPQFFTKRTFNNQQAIDGLKQMLWGFFKKLVIADNCAVFANMIFDNPANFTGSELALGALFFTIQIYGDFSGYSDIAIGTARLFGFNLKQNFAFPYFSRDIAEFWRRWHMSLSTWFRDYLYIPLGGSRGSKAMIIRNTFIIFIVSGFWHGANWTFIIWGSLHALYFLPLLLLNRNRIHLDVIASNRYLPSLTDGGRMLVTFVLTAFAWIFFRAESVGHAFDYIGRLFSASLFKIPTLDTNGIWSLLAFFFIVEWLGREHPYAISKLGVNWPKSFRWATYILIMIVIFYCGNFHDHTFIYFQF